MGEQCPNNGRTKRSPSGELAGLELVFVNENTQVSWFLYCFILKYFFIVSVLFKYFSLHVLLLFGMSTKQTKKGKKKIDTIQTRQ